MDRQLSCPVDLWTVVRRLWSRPKGKHFGSKAKTRLEYAELSEYTDVLQARGWMGAGAAVKRRIERVLASLGSAVDLLSFLFWLLWNFEIAFCPSIVILLPEGRSPVLCVGRCKKPTV